jgi:hypothetical protein
MSEVTKVLGQLAPSATTLTDLYTVPGSTAAVVSTLQVCNRGGTDTTFRIAVSPAGAAIASAHYVYYDLAIVANDSFAATIGITLAATDVVRVYAGNANLSFSLFGVEIS